VRDFQANVGMRVDGIVGSETVAAIRRLHRQHQSAPAAVVREREALRARPPRESLAGSRVLIDPAHGPDDPGATGPDGRQEHEICWEIASRLEGRLLAHGVNVVLSRGPATSPSTSARARLANAENVDAVVSIHLNALESSVARGVAAYYYGDGDFQSESGRRLASLCLDELVARTGSPDCRAHPSVVSILRETRAPAVIVEPGFLSHPDESRQLQDTAYQAEIAEGLSVAVSTYLTGQIARAAESTAV
jgi:N-acetylmuramoyl-L-alanine amidase